MLVPLRKTSEWSIVHSYSPSRTSISSSTSTNMDPPVVPSSRCGIHNITRLTSIRDSEELITKYTTGGISEDVFLSMVPLELPPSDISTQSILQVAGCAHGAKRHSWNASFGMLPMARFLAGCDDPSVLSMVGMPPMPWPTSKLPVREKPPLHIPSTPGILSSQPAAWESSRNSSPKTGWIRARQWKPAAQEPLEARRRVLGEQASPPEKQDSPYSKIVQSTNGKGQSSSSPSGNPNSRGKAGANSKKGCGQTSGGRAEKNSAPQGGDGVGNGGNDPSKKSNGEVKEPADALDWYGYPCFLRKSKTDLDVRCLSECAANASLTCKHLAKIHGYRNENLYLVEPESNTAKHSNRRRGLCKVCYEVFDYFERPEGYVQDANLMGRNEDKFLLEHVKHHEQAAKREGKENASPDNQESTPLKYVAMMLLFGVRQSLNEIRAKHSIPFTKLGKAPVVKLEMQTRINTNGLASFAGQDLAMHTPTGSVSGSFLKRSFSPLEELHNLTRPQKQHKGALQAPLQLVMSASSDSSLRVPSLDDSNGLYSSDGSSFSNINANLEHTVPNFYMSPTPASPLFETGKLNDVISSAHAIQDKHTPSRDDSPGTLPIVDDPFQWHHDGLFSETPNQSTDLIQNSLRTPNRVTPLADGSVVSWTGTKMTVGEDGSFVESYDPFYDLRPLRGRDDETDRMRNLADSNGVSVLEPESEERHQLFDLVHDTDK